jgi:hypothetical protein
VTAVTNETCVTDTVYILVEVEGQVRDMTDRIWKSLDARIVQQPLGQDVGARPPLNSGDASALTRSRLLVVIVGKRALAVLG